MFKNMGDKLNKAAFTIKPNPVHAEDEKLAAEIKAAVGALEAVMTQGYRAGLQTSFSGFVLNEEEGTFKINGLAINKRLIIG